MANLSSKPRWQLVLDALRAAGDKGVLTAELENAAVGGTAGTARVRELRKRGYQISATPHPDPAISQYVYRLEAEPNDAFTYSLTKGGKDLVMDLTPTDQSGWVQWHKSLRDRGFTARHNGCDLWVAPTLGGNWVYRVAGPDGLRGSGLLRYEQEAKRAAQRSAERA